MPRLRKRKARGAAVPAVTCSFPDSVTAPGEPAQAQRGAVVSLRILPWEDSLSPGEGLGLGQLGRKPTS